MAKMFSEYTSQFFWDFKRMDNVEYNFAVIEHLYAARKSSSDPSRLNKPIVILFVAIIECALYDFLCRIRGRTSDPLPNLARPIIDYLNGANHTDELNIMLPRIRSQNLLRVKTGDTLYSDLEHLRLCRNRIHIQNKFNTLARDEDSVFTDQALQTAENCFERVIETLCNAYPRWNKQPLPMNDFPRPWL